MTISSVFESFYGHISNVKKLSKVDKKVVIATFL